MSSFLIWGLTNPPTFLIQAGRRRGRGETNTWWLEKVSSAVVSGFTMNGSCWPCCLFSCRAVCSGDHVHHHHVSLHSGSRTAPALHQPSQDVSWVFLLTFIHAVVHTRFGAAKWNPFHIIKLCLTNHFHQSLRRVTQETQPRRDCKKTLILNQLKLYHKPPTTNQTL